MRSHTRTSATRITSIGDDSDRQSAGNSVEEDEEEEEEEEQEREEEREDAVGRMPELMHSLTCSCTRWQQLQKRRRDREERETRDSRAGKRLRQEAKREEEFPFLPSFLSVSLSLEATRHLPPTLFRQPFASFFHLHISSFRLLPSSSLSSSLHRSFTIPPSHVNPTDARRHRVSETERHGDPDTFLTQSLARDARREDCTSRDPPHVI